jgi:hypothetical protein
MEDITKSLDDMESKFLNSEKIPKKIKVVYNFNYSYNFFCSSYDIFHNFLFH